MVWKNKKLAIYIYNTHKFKMTHSATNNPQRFPLTQQYKHTLQNQSESHHYHEFYSIQHRVVNKVWNPAVKIIAENHQVY